jgi:hypothetical protein
VARVGWAMTALLVLFLLGASVAPKLLGMAAAADSFTSLDWPLEHTRLIGTLELAFALLFAWPRTGPLGAVLLTALFGGALASHLRVGSPLFSHTLFGIYLGVFMWLALYLRDARFRAYASSLVR